MSVHASILTLLAATAAQGAEALLHVSGISQAPIRALLCAPAGAAPAEIEVRDGHLGRPFAVPAEGEATLTLLGDDGTPILRPLPFKTPKAGERQVLIVSPGLPSGARLTLVPIDLGRHPLGASAFLNLSDNVVRCWLGPRSVEVRPGTSAIHPLEGSGRRLVNHRVEYLAADGTWTHDSSTTLILAAGRRFIFTVGPGRAEDGPLLRYNVTDHAPEENARPAEPLSPPAPTPPPHPPAK